MILFMFSFLKNSLYFANNFVEYLFNIFMFANVMTCTMFIHFALIMYKYFILLLFIFTE